MEKVYKQHIFFSYAGCGKTTEINKEVSKLNNREKNILENTGVNPNRVLYIDPEDLEVTTRLDRSISLRGLDYPLRGNRDKYDALVIEDIYHDNLPLILPLLARYQELNDIEHLYLSYSLGEY